MGRCKLFFISSPFQITNLDKGTMGVALAYATQPEEVRSSCISFLQVWAHVDVLLDLKEPGVERGGQDVYTIRSTYQLDNLNRYILHSHNKSVSLDTPKLRIQLLKEVITNRRTAAKVRFCFW